MRNLECNIIRLIPKPEIPKVGKKTELLIYTVLFILSLKMLFKIFTQSSLMLVKTEEERHK